MRLVCKNIPRQPLEKDSTDIELFYYDKKKIKKGKYIKYGVRQKEILNNLLKNNGVYFYFIPFRFNILSAVRLLKSKGHLVKFFNYTTVNQTHMKVKLPRFILIYYAGKEKEALNKLFKKFPQIVGRPQYLRKFSVPIIKNLHTLATESIAKHYHRKPMIHHIKKCVCGCGNTFKDMTSNQSRKYFSKKCKNKVWRLKKKDERAKSNKI